MPEPTTAGAREALDWLEHTVRFAMAGQSQQDAFAAINSLRAALAQAERERDEWQRRAARLPNLWERARGGGPGASGAYRYGYECAWRAWGYDNLYDRRDCRDAYDRGYEAGEHDSAAAPPPEEASRE